MIKINERFSTKRDNYCWHLIESKKGKDKEGNEKVTQRVSYHGKLNHIAQEILDRSAGYCESVEEIVDLLKSAESMVTVKIEAVAGVPRQRKRIAKEPTDG